MVFQIGDTFSLSKEWLFLEKFRSTYPLWHFPLIWIQQEDVSATNSTFCAELVWQWKNCEWFSNLICLPMASYLTELLIQGSPQLSLAHAGDIMDWPKLTRMEKAWYDNNQPVSVRVSLWWALFLACRRLPSSCVLTWCLLCAHTERKISPVSPLFLKGHQLFWSRALLLCSQLILIVFLKALTLIESALKVGVSTWVLVGVKFIPQHSTNTCGIFTMCKCSLTVNSVYMWGN